MTFYHTITTARFSFKAQLTPLFTFLKPSWTLVYLNPPPIRSPFYPYSLLVSNQIQPLPLRFKNVRKSCVPLSPTALTPPSIRVSYPFLFSLHADSQRICHSMLSIILCSVIIIANVPTKRGWITNSCDLEYVSWTCHDKQDKMCWMPHLYQKHFLSTAVPLPLSREHAVRYLKEISHYRHCLHKMPQPLFYLQARSMNLQVNPEQFELWKLTSSQKSQR